MVKTSGNPLRQQRVVAILRCRHSKSSGWRRIWKNQHMKRPSATSIQTATTSGVVRGITAADPLSTRLLQNICTATPSLSGKTSLMLTASPFWQ